MENQLAQVTETEKKTIFLIDARSAFEFNMVKNWIKGRPEFDGQDPVAVRFGETHLDMSDELHSALEKQGGEDNNPWLQPVRPVWNTSERAAGTGSLIADLFSGMRYHPGQLRQRLIAKMAPEHVNITKGAGAYLSEIRQRFDSTWAKEGVSETRLPEFIFRQALITLDRAERNVRGARYKVARLLKQDVTAHPGFQRNLGGLAGVLGKSLSDVETTSERYLDEMSATQTPFSLDMMIGLQRRACQSGHDPKIDFIPEQLAELKSTMKEVPVVLLVTHKSMLDTMSVSCLLFDNNIPVPLGFGGINLNTIGLGQLATRSGIIFLRRAFQDNEIYKATFRRYVDYLVEKRFSLMWALEGTRSRTGKLLPPRYGLTNYVVESILRTQLHGVKFVPVSISFDQIAEVDDYVIEQRGQKKKPEGAGWIFKFLKSKKPLGKIYIRFGQSVTATEILPAEQLNESLDKKDKKMLVEQISMRAAVRLNNATPITLTALVMLILLANGRRGRTLAGLTKTVENWMKLVKRRNIPIAGSAKLSSEQDVDETLRALETNGVVTRTDSGMGPIFQISPGQFHKAAYYRNTVIHFFVTDALIELSLKLASEQQDSEIVFWREIVALRDLLKFEFYFETREEFLTEVRTKLAERDDDWETTLQTGGVAVRDLLDKSKPLVAQGVLRSFIDAYQVCADVLCRLEGKPVGDTPSFINDCMVLGQQSHLLHRIFSEESVSTVLYKTALKLAEHLGLTGDDNGSLVEDRKAFSEQVKSVNRRLEVLLSVAVSRQTD